MSASVKWAKAGTSVIAIVIRLSFAFVCRGCRVVHRRIHPARPPSAGRAGEYIGPVSSSGGGVASPDRRIFRCATGYFGNTWS